MDQREQRDRKFRPPIEADDWEEMKSRVEDAEEFFTLLAEPLHEELYKRSKPDCSTASTTCLFYRNPLIHNDFSE